MSGPRAPFPHLRHVFAVIALTNVIMPCFTEAAELPPNQVPSKSEDWAQAHRIKYQELTIQLDGPQMIAAMPQVAGFSNAALYNLKNNKPSEYKNVIQRNAFYDLISLVVEFDEKTKPAVMPVRFFHAATRVTGRLPLGAIDWAPSVTCNGLDTNVRNFMRKINEILFAHNMPVIHKLLFVWEGPRDPRIASPTAALPAWDFDLAMVEYEQDRITKQINDENPSAALKTKVNSALNCDGSLHEIAMFFALGEVRPWLERAGIEKLDFFNSSHRKALGKAIISIFHKRLESDFRKAIGLT